MINFIIFLIGWFLFLIICNFLIKGFKKEIKSEKPEDLSWFTPEVLEQVSGTTYLPESIQTQPQAPIYNNVILFKNLKRSRDLND